MSDPNIPPIQPPLSPTPPAGPDVGVVEMDLNARNLAMITYILGLTLWVGPLIMYLVKKDDPATSPFVKQEAKKALNWGLTAQIGVIVGIITTPLFCLGVILNAAIFITNIVFVILNAMKANKGQPGSYPFSIPFFK